MRTIQSIQQDKNEVEKQIQQLLLSSDFQKMKELRKRKTYLTRQMAMVRFRQRKNFKEHL